MKSNNIFTFYSSCFCYKIFVCILFISYSTFSYSQCVPSAAVECQGIPNSGIETSPPENIDFIFDSFNKYNGGITISGSTFMKLTVTPNTGNCIWRLKMYVDNLGTVPNTEWSTLATYGGSGVTPDLDIIQVKVYNPCGTPALNNVFQFFPGPATVSGASIDIINDLAQNLAGPCNGTMVNGPGTYLGPDYGQFIFRVDYRVVPGLNYTAGMYQIKIRFCIELD